MGDKIVTERIFKSLEEYLSDIVSEFNYTDFSAHNDPDRLRDIFNEKFSKENAFWEMTDKTYGYKNLFVLKVKTSDELRTARIRFEFERDDIFITVFNDHINGKYFDESYEEVVSLKKVWINHKELFDRLKSVFNYVFDYIFQ